MRQSCYGQILTTFPCNYFESNACKYFFTFLARLYSKLKKNTAFKWTYKNNENTIFTVALAVFALTLIIHGRERARFYFKYR